MKTLAVSILFAITNALSGNVISAQVIGSVKPFERPAGMPESFENIVLHRIQLRITTATQQGSENDQGVYVQMNEHDIKFYLSRGIDNFEKGKTDTYDFISPTINKVEDIQFLKIGVKGGDGWRMRKIELFLNDNDYPVFAKDYGTKGLVLDDAASMTIPGNELRLSPNWKYTNNNRTDIWKAPQYIRKNTLISMVEAVIGDNITQRSGFKWGTKSGVRDTRWGPVVEASFKDASTLHFDLDLLRVLTGPNPEVDVDFDLEFACEDGVITYKITNITYDTDFVGEAQEKIRREGSIMLGAAIGSSSGFTLVGAAAGSLLAKYLDYGINFKINGEPNKAICDKLTVLPSGDIKLY